MDVSTYVRIGNLRQVDLVREMAVGDTIFLSVPPTTTTGSCIIHLDEDVVRPVKGAFDADADAVVEGKGGAEDVEICDATFDDAALDDGGCVAGGGAAWWLGGGDADAGTVFWIQEGADRLGEVGFATGGEGIEGVCFAGVVVEHGGSGRLLGFSAEGVEIGVEGFVLVLRLEYNSWLVLHEAKIGINDG